MPNVFVTSDTHFGHAGVCRFERADGSGKLRPWSDPAEMDEAMVAKWNAVVGPNDRVYHLGDVVINRKALVTLGRLNGTKILIKGNHDVFKLHEYTQYFEDIRAYHVMNNFIFSHIPVHRDSKGRFDGNVHGHTHDRVMMKRTWYGKRVVDPWYKCVCVEQTDFQPVPLETLFKEMRERS